MKKLPPSEKMRKELRQYVAQEAMAKESLISGLAQRATQTKINQFLDSSTLFKGFWG